jgi:hypothetical protein
MQSENKGEVSIYPVLRSHKSVMRFAMTSAFLIAKDCSVYLLTFAADDDRKSEPDNPSNGGIPRRDDDRRDGSNNETSGPSGKNGSFLLPYVPLRSPPAGPLQPLPIGQGGTLAAIIGRFRSMKKARPKVTRGRNRPAAPTSSRTGFPDPPGQPFLPKCSRPDDDRRDRPQSFQGKA